MGSGAGRFYGGQSGGGSGISMPRGVQMSVTVTGLKKLDARLAKLSAEVRTKVLRKAMLKATDIILHRAERLAPDDTGRLADAIRRRIKIGANEITGSVYVLRKGKRGAPHAHLVHKGTKTRVADHTWVRRSRGVTFVTVRGQSFGRMKANPFMTKAFEGKKMAVRAEFIKHVRVALDKVRR